MNINICAMGDGWLAVDKPAGVTVHNDPGKDLCSIVSGIIDSDEGLREKVGPKNDFGLHPVHRLDKETSGLILLAATPEAFRFLSEQFTSRKVTKRYFALFHGLLKSSPGNETWGTWQWPLTKTAGGRTKPEGSGKKLPSLTRYLVLGHSRHYTLAEVEISTGRKHQIRRHAKLAGHPVVGDARYGSTRAVNFLTSQCSFTRLGLHAKSISLSLSDDKPEETILTREIPVEMKFLFENDCQTNQPG